VAIVPVDLLCLASLVMGIGVPHRSNWPHYLLLLAITLVEVSFSTGLAWLSIRLWRNPRWQWISFPLAILYYAALAVTIWAVAFKH